MTEVSPEMTIASVARSMRRVGRIRRIAGLCATLMGLAACERATGVMAAKEIGSGVLAPFEDYGWPSYLERLELPRDRDYIILAYVPPANPIDLSTPERARGTMAKMVFDQFGAIEAGTTIGHLIVGWQCGDRRGMTSMSGEFDLQGQKMFLSGWGVTPVLSTFLDGDIVEMPDFPERQNRALVEGRGVVVASEVPRAACQTARDEVKRFETHPNAPHRNYSLLERPDIYEGGGCLSFALHIAQKAGVMPRLTALARRTLPIRAVQLGAREDVPEGVVAYRAPEGHPEKPVGWLELITKRWDQGPVIDHVTVPDGEAIMAAMVYARVGVGPKNDWRYGRIMSHSDPVVGPAGSYGYAWANQYPVRRIADPDGVSALVLERD